MSQSAGQQVALEPVHIVQNRPKGVLAAAAVADQFFAEQAALRTAAANPPAVDPANQPVAPVALQPSIEQMLQTPAQPPAAQPNEPPAPLQPSIEPSDLEHRYRSAQGRERAAIARAERAENDNNELRMRLDALEAVQRNPSLAQPAGPLPDLTPEEVETLGPDLLRMVNVRAQIIARGETARLQAELDSLRNTFQASAQRQVLSARDNMMLTIDTEVPEWRVLNEDPKFLAWLGEHDILAGNTRHNLFLDAYEHNDTQRVVAFFKNFGNGVFNQATQPHAQAANQPLKVPLEVFTAPGRGTPSAVTTAAPGKPTFTNQQVEQFYGDVRRGKFRGREAEQNRLEAEIILAGAEGRIT